MKMEREILKEAKDLYLKEYGSLENFEDAYVGTYESYVDFVWDQIETYGIELPNWLVVDFEATWQCNLRHDFLCLKGAGNRYHFFWAM